MENDILCADGFSTGATWCERWSVLLPYGKKITGLMCGPGKVPIHHNWNLDYIKDMVRVTGSGMHYLYLKSSQIIKTYVCGPRIPILVGTFFGKML